MKEMNRCCKVSKLYPSHYISLVDKLGLDLSKSFGDPGYLEFECKRQNRIEAKKNEKN